MSMGIPTGTDRYPHLFSPIKIRGHVYRNRIITGPTMFAEFIFNPEYSENIYRMMEKRAAGGAAEVVTGELTLGDENAEHLFSVNVDIDEREGKVFEGFCEYARRIHKHGAVALLELCHSGGDVDRFTEERMQKICNVFYRGAAFAREAGFDGVLIHGGHGFLLQQFVSPLTNHRTDEYGGKPENRARFPKRVLKALREGLGEDGILEMRFSAEDGVPGGMTIEDSLAFFREIDGMPDIIHLSNGRKSQGYRTHTFTGPYDIHGYNIPFAAKVKQAVTKSKVAVIGGINDPAMCEDAIREGKTDFVIISRQAIADPEFANKAREGREDAIRKCIRCYNCYPGPSEHESEAAFPHPGGLMPPPGGNPPPPPGPGGPPPFAERPFWEEKDPLEAMLSAIRNGGLNIGECTINPEANLRIYPELFADVKESRKVLVIGGGPSGIQAAITAVKRGHEVTLVERDDRLGGVLKIMEQDEDKKDLYEFRNLLERELYESGAEVILNCDRAEDYINSGTYDHVIIALGGHTRTPDIPGFENALEVIEAYAFPERLGKRVVVIGSGYSGCEAALYFARLGCEVTVLSRRNKLVPEATGLSRTALLDEMEKRGVGIRKETLVQSIGTDHVMILDLVEGQKKLPADSVVYATGTDNNYDEAEQLSQLCLKNEIRFSFIGDCVKAGRVVQATREGYIAAMLVN